ncbi:Zn(II)2Cys6 transcription factor domain-containing protein [Aspergillus stella-maris]|uniref:Zn(II)2Cys6 transcription factor domain-containing protein n=1 Tax=Aspergillus stella-maris TaxID=1810926 RepID=UPI003CCDDCE5
MSLRRKSCNPCFRSRRKCNLAYPTCGTCRRTNKACQYAYPPVGARTPSGSSNGALIAIDATEISSLDYLDTGAVSDLFNQYAPPQSGVTPRFRLPSTPPDYVGISRFCGSLGDVQPIEGSTASWQWVIDKFKSYPDAFARQASTIFIHEDLYSDTMPRSMRTAYGISASSCLLTDRSRGRMFKTIDDEVSDLLNSTERTSIIEDLASLQALTLYQTIRFFNGDLKQRATAEQQQSILFSWALKLVTRSQTELRDVSTREGWLLAECIRRTAIIVYFLYGVNSIFREGICIGLPTLAKLPLSTELGYWDREQVDGDCRELALSETMSYETFMALWLVSTPRKLDPFEKLLLVPCQGLDTVERFDNAAIEV